MTSSHENNTWMEDFRKDIAGSGKQTVCHVCLREMDALMESMKCLSFLRLTGLFSGGDWLLVSFREVYYLWQPGAGVEK